MTAKKHKFEWPVAGADDRLTGNECLRASGKDGPQIIETTGGRWNASAEARFLSHLAVSCNITASAKKAGFTREALYARRMRDSAFAERWDAALHQGYCRIEMLLVKMAEDTLSGVAIDPDSPIPPMTVSEAMNVLKLHQRTVKGDGKNAHRWRLAPADPQAARAEILKKVAAVRLAKGYE